MSEAIQLIDPAFKAVEFETVPPVSMWVKQGQGSKRLVIAVSRHKARELGWTTGTHVAIAVPNSPMDRRILIHDVDDSHPNSRKLVASGRSAVRAEFPYNAQIAAVVPMTGVRTPLRVMPATKEGRLYLGTDGIKPQPLPERKVKSVIESRIKSNGVPAAA